MNSLQGTVAVVTGASRGIGQGIAHELGLASATVYVTGRSRDGQATTDDLPGTIDATARLVTEAGGQGLAVACDHTHDAAVEALAARVRAEQGRLDLLVNNVWGGYEQYDAALFELPVWEQPLWRWDKMFDTGVRAHYTASRALTPLLCEAARGLIVNISAGDDGKFLGDVQYDVAKAAIDRLGFALARKLKRYGVAALTIHPGFTRTERVEAAAPPEALAQTHSARFVGRAVVALATDTAVMQRTGGAFKAGQLGLDYGFRDIDGSQPAPFTLPDAYGE
jgi:NAD(P)-dependent dehydrogenase (short-subunit alcohol dehydrogenase family)